MTRTIWPVRMIRRTAVCAALACAFLVVPAKADAQIGQPLRSLCVTSALDYCMSILSWDFEYVSAPLLGYVPAAAVGQLSVTFDLWGSGFDQGPLQIFNLQMFNGGGDTYHWNVRNATAGRYYDLQESAPTGYPAEPTVDDLAVLDFIPAVGQGYYCVPRSDHPIYTGPACHEVPVPEPGTYLLMLTGLLGLGFVAWRGRDALA